MRANRSHRSPTAAEHPADLTLAALGHDQLEQHLAAVLLDELADPPGASDAVVELDPVA